MIIYLHEFPSSEGIYYEIENQVKVIKFRHYEVTANKYYSMLVRFRWGDVKVELVNVEMIGVHTVVLPDELESFRDIAIQLFSLFHKYDHYWWMPKAQIPKHLTTAFFDRIMALYSS